MARAISSVTGNPLRLVNIDITSSDPELSTELLLIYRHDNSTNNKFWLSKGKGAKRF